MANKEASGPREMNRKDFLAWLAVGSLGTTFVLSGRTIALAVFPPGRSIEGKTKMGPTPLVAVDKLENGQPQIFEYGDDFVFLAKDDKGEIVALNAACPHVACKLHWEKEHNRYSCPCHESYFEFSGKKILGPSPRDMFKAAFEVKDGQVVVTGVKAG